MIETLHPASCRALQTDSLAFLRNQRDHVQVDKTGLHHLFSAAIYEMTCR